VRDRYPALSEFARAYLHEELEREHGSAEAALEAFLAAAAPAERSAVAREAARLGRRLAGWPVARVRELVRDELGSAWWPARAADVRRLLARAGQLSRGPGTRHRPPIDGTEGPT
jgi:hypothetical protein